MGIIGKLFRRKFKPPFKSEFIITEAFECGGVKYYQFDDSFNIPYERALQALTYYEELRMRCTREFLIKHTQTVESILNDPKRISIGKLALLNMHLKERLEWIIEPDIAYKLASVVFFDKNESPYAYDFKYAQKKIEHWKKTKGVDAFFLQAPLKFWMPLSDESETNFPLYLQAIEKLTKQHQETVSSILSEKPKGKDSGKN